MPDPARRTAAAPSSLGLRRIRLFEGLPAPVLDSIARQCAWRRLDAGQVLISRNQRDRDVYLLVDGRVRVTIYASSGRQVTFRDLGTGDIVGEIAATDGGPRSVDVVALDALLVGVLSAADFRQLRHDHPLLAERFATHLVGLVRLLTEAVIELGTLGVQNRVHADLLRLARAATPGADANVCLLSPAPTHAELAARISTTREQVTRELSALVKSGLLEKVPGGLRVTDVERLERLVARASDAG